MKTDALGRKRPWIDRKTDHLNALRDASVEARGVVLADKLHNLVSIGRDVAEGRDIWSRFHADRDRVLWYYRTTIEQLGTGDPRLVSLAEQARRVLVALEGTE